MTFRVIPTSSSAISSPHLRAPDYKAMAKQARRDDIAQRIVDQIDLRPAGSTSLSGGSDTLATHASVVMKDGIFAPQFMFKVMDKLRLCAEETLAPHGDENLLPVAKSFLTKLRNFEKNFVHDAVGKAGEKGHSLSQDDLGLVAHDLLRFLADDARDLGKSGACDQGTADIYKKFLKHLAKFHVTYCAKHQMVETAKRTVEGLKVKNPYIDKPQAGARSSSDKALYAKAGVGYDLHLVDVSAKLQAGGARTRDILKDDDDDVLYYVVDYGEGGASLIARVSAAKVASAGGTLAYKKRNGSGYFIDAPTVQAAMEVEAARRPNRNTFPGSRSSHPATRKYFEAWRKYSSKAGNFICSNAFRFDTDYFHFLDNQKLFEYSACQAALHSHADALSGTSTSPLCEDFLRTFKAAYPEEDYRVVNDMTQSTIAGITSVESSKEKDGPFTSSVESVTLTCDAKVLGVVGTSAGLAYLRKAKALEFEKLLDSHEILNPVYAGSLERSTFMIDSAFFSRAIEAATFFT